MALSNEQLTRVTRGFIRRVFQEPDAVAVVHTGQIADAAVAGDAHFTSIAAAASAALPAEFTAAVPSLQTQQLLYALVLMERAGISAE